MPLPTLCRPQMRAPRLLLLLLAAAAVCVHAAIPPYAWQQLQAAITGSIVLPADAAYSNDTTQWNSRFRHFPAGIVYCNTSNDVALTLKFAQL